MKLNGHQVIAIAPSRTHAGANVVMVYQQNDPNSYVVAHHSDSLGKEWVWGHYFDDILKAAQCFDEKRRK